MKDISTAYFKYSGRNYFFSVSLSSILPSGETINFVFDNSFITDFYYINEFNGMFLTGGLKCIDKFGKIDDFLHLNYVYCDVIFNEQENDEDEGIVISGMGERTAFKHRFIVNNIEILDRHAGDISYKMSLMSISWLNCISNITFSNYDKEPESIFDILKACIALSKQKFDKSLFGMIKTDVKMNYITTGNDNLLSITDFLLSKLYYNKIKDDSLKFIIYNETDNCYQLLDLKNKSSITGVYTYVISFMNTATESMTQQAPINIATVTKSSKKKLIKSLFHTNLYSYDYKENKIGNEKIEQPSLLSYINSKSPDDKFPKKYKYLYIPDLKYDKNNSFWNNNINVYNDLTNELMDDNTLVLTVDGNILLKPGSIINISVDRDITSLESNNRSELEKLKKKYNSFDGTWLSTKIRHIINPSAGTYRQNVCITRNYLLK